MILYKVSCLTEHKHEHPVNTVKIYQKYFIFLTKTLDISSDDLEQIWLILSILQNIVLFF